MKIDVIPNRLEKYMAFILNKNFVFIVMVFFRLLICVLFLMRDQGSCVFPVSPPFYLSTMISTTFSLFTPNLLLTCDWNHGLKVWKPLKFCNSWITKHSSLVFPQIFFVAYTQNNYLVLIYARWFIFYIFQDKLQLILVWYVIGIFYYQYTILYCSSYF